MRVARHAIVAVLFAIAIAVACRPLPDNPGRRLLSGRADPDPEIEPLVALERGAAFAAAGKGINNVLGFPGLFRGALDARAARFTDAMLIAAARTIAEQAAADDLVPDALDKSVHAAVAESVRRAARA